MSSLPIVDDSSQEWQMVPYAEFSNKHLLQEDDASSSTEQPKANSLQTSRVPNVGIFHHRMLHHRVQPSFEVGLLFCFLILLLFPSLPLLLSLSLLFLFVFKISCVPTQEEDTKEIEAKI